MTEKQTLLWIKLHLAGFINQALAEAKAKNPSLLYTEDWLAGMTYREVGELIARYVSQGKQPQQIHALMKGDYGQRPGEKTKSYHGYSYMQIDIASYPQFINSGKWQDPLECYRKAIEVLEEKRIYLFASNRFNVKDFPLDTAYRAITAAYNCGQGNVAKALREGKSVDIFTHQRNYSAEVWRFREIYKSLP